MSGKRASEQGFTLTEVLVVIVLLGLIGTPLYMALTQALRVSPESAARSMRAGERLFLSDTFERDTANTLAPPQSTDPPKVYEPGSATAKPWDPAIGQAVVSHACSEMTAPAKLVLWIANLNGDGTVAPTKVTYFVQISHDGAVNITRSTADGTPVKVTVGYCTINLDPSAPQVFQMALATSPPTCVDNSTPDSCPLIHEAIDIELQLEPQPGDQIETVHFKGSLGRTIKQAPADT